MQLEEGYYPSTSLQGIGAKFIGEPVVSITATDGVSRLGIIRKDNNSLAVGATSLFKRDNDKLVPLFPQPEGKAGSKGAVDDVASLSSLSTL